MSDDTEQISGAEAYTAIKNSQNSFYSLFFQAEGYHPPTVVRFLVIGTYASIMGLLAVSLFTLIDYFLLNSELSQYIPSSALGSIIGFSDIGPSIVLAVVAISLMVSVYVFSVLASKISLPYEEEYLDWAEEILPSNDPNEYYPPYEYWADQHIDEKYLQEESIPSTAPSELRELTGYEEFRKWVGQTARQGVHYFYLVVTMQMAIIIQNNSNVEPITNRDRER